MKTGGTSLKLISTLVLAVSLPAYAQDGALDESFGGDGIVASNFGTGWKVARAVAVFPDGSILAGGSAGTGANTTDFYVVRYRANGSVDSDWGQFGSQLVPIDGAHQIQDDLEAIVLTADGAATLLGTTGASGGATIPTMVRLTPEGGLDPAFGTAGIVVADGFPWGGFKHTYGVTAHLGGFLFAGNCGECGPGSSNGFFLYRALGNGAADPAFGNGGWLGMASGFNTGTNLWAATAMADGRILLATTHTPVGEREVRIFRLLPSGAPDPSFGGGDGLTSFIAPDDWNPSAIAVDPVDGSIVVGLRWGLEQSSVVSGSIARLSADGVHDTSFGFPDLTFDEGSTIEDLVIASDRKIVAAGRIDATGAQAGGFFFARLRPDGELDDSFDGNGVKRVEIDAVENGNDASFGIALNGGRPVAVGRNATQDGGNVFAVVRLKNALIFTDGFEGGGTTPSW